MSQCYRVILHDFQSELYLFYFLLCKLDGILFIFHVSKEPVQIK